MLEKVIKYQPINPIDSGDLKMFLPQSINPLPPPPPPPLQALPPEVTEPKPTTTVHSNTTTNDLVY